MKYPEMTAIGSSLAPKILGSYEQEIQQVIERICTVNYNGIIDIGCAEGYYAVGLARRIKTARVYAFDTNKEALRLCREMARVNDVSDRIITGNYCDMDVLKSIPLVGRTLIISDCEGYEKHLFTEKSASFFRLYDLLIELHDFVDINISSQIRAAFQLTHDIESYESIDDIKKVQQYDYAELMAFDLATRKEILAERRPTIMDWYYMKSRQVNNHL
jgi:ribosomal protein L11 methylase PrmA